jgi:antitoxin HicB
MKPKYSLIIRWSDEDRCFIAWAPEFGSGVKSHGSTYEEAARMGKEIIELMLDSEDADSRPKPWLFSDPAADDRLGRHLFPENKAYGAARISSPRRKSKHATA